MTPERVHARRFPQFVAMSALIESLEQMLLLEHNPNDYLLRRNTRVRLFCGILKEIKYDRGT